MNPSTPSATCWHSHIRVFESGERRQGNKTEEVTGYGRKTMTNKHQQPEKESKKVNLSNLPLFIFPGILAKSFFFDACFFFFIF